MKIEQKAMAVWQSVALQRGLLRSCVNCDQWQKNETCGLTPNQRPPAMVIVLGCNSWEDGIPF